MEELDLFSYNNTPKPSEEKTLQPSSPQPEELTPPVTQSLPQILSEAEPAQDIQVQAGGRSLVISIHDVSPLTREATERILSELTELGVRKVSLLVIPDHHHKGHFLDDPGFCTWLEERAAAGDEVVIHGYYHRRDQRAG